MSKWRVEHGDCLEIMRGMDDASVDAVVTDPPYAISVKGAAHDGPRGTRNLDFFPIDHDWDACVSMVLEAASECVRLLKPSGSMYWWCGHRQFGPLVSLLESRGFKTRFLVWAKKCPPPPPPRAGWPSGAELCVYAYRPGRTWNYDSKSVPRSNVIVSDSYRHGQPGKVGHPTQKPFGVIDPLIEASVPDGGIVLDPFTGSGTVGVSAVSHGFNFIGCELDADYVNIARQRIEHAVIGAA